MSRVIGIGGLSRSGKTTLANQLSRELDDATVIHQDKFNATQLPTIRDHIDWEIPQAVDYKALISAVTDAKKKYAYVIVDGILIYADHKLNELFDQRFVLTLEEEDFRKRKSSDLRWGRREPDWYVAHIYNSFWKYGFPPERYDCMIIDASGDFTQDVIKSVLHFEKG